MIRPSRGGIRCAMTCAAPGAAASSLANASKPTIVVDPTLVSGNPRRGRNQRPRSLPLVARRRSPRCLEHDRPERAPGGRRRSCRHRGRRACQRRPQRRGAAALDLGQQRRKRQHRQAQPGRRVRGLRVGAAGHRDQHRKCRAPQLRQRRVRDRWRLRGRIAVAAGRDDLARDRPDLGRKSGDDRTQDRRDLALESGPQPSGVDVLDPVGDRRARLPQETGNGVRAFGAVHRRQRRKRGTARRGVRADQRPGLGVTAGIATQGQRQNAPRGHRATAPRSASPASRPPETGPTPSRHRYVRVGRRRVPRRSPSPPGTSARTTRPPHPAETAASSREVWNPLRVPSTMTACGAEGITAQSLLAPGAGGGYVSRP